MHNDLKIKKEALPSSVPVFPLTGALLLPGAELPLNIFEPKYINMVDDALAEKKLIGMIQPKQGIFSKIRKNKPLYDVGCLGKIKAYNETDDGRYLIVLSGVCRFKIKDEISTMRGYRRFKVSCDDYLEDFDQQQIRRSFNGKIDRRELFSNIDSYISSLTDEAKNFTSNQAFDQTDDTFIIDFMCSYMPFSPQEKQKFLECKSVEERADILFKALANAEETFSINDNVTIH